MESTQFRIVYLLFFSIYGALSPFFNPHLRALQFSDLQIGWVNSAPGAMMMVLPLLFGHVADRYVAPRTLIQIGLLIMSVALFKLSAATHFHTVMAWYLMYAIGIASIPGLLIGFTFSRFSHARDRGAEVPSYVSIRLFGSVGFLAAVLVLYALFHYAHLELEVAISFGGVLALMAAAATFLLPGSTPNVHRVVQGLPARNAFAALFSSTTGPMTATIFILAFTSAMFMCFYARYLQELHLAPQWIGLAMNLGVAAEVVLFTCMPTLIRKVGLRQMMLIGVGGMALRLALLAGYPSVVLALVTQIFHAPLALALFIVPSVFINHSANEDFRSSTQAAFSVLTGGAATLLGAFAGGYLTTLGTTPLLGLQIVFLVGAACNVFGTGLVVLKLSFSGRERAF